MIKLDVSKLETGDVVLQHTVSYLLKPSTRAAWVIRKVTKSKWNHSGEIFMLGEDIYVLESIWGGITLTPWSEFIKQDAFVKIIRLKDFKSKFNKKDYLIKGLRQLDKRYDYFGILKIFVYICTGRWDNISKRRSMTKWRCSEFNAWMKDIRWRQSRFPWDFDDNDDFETIFY